MSVFASLCDAPLLLQDREVVDELKAYDFKSLRPSKPIAYDSFGRAYFYHPALQPAMSVRLFRTVGSWRPGKEKMYKVTGIGYSGEQSDTDPREGGEIVAESGDDIESLLATPSLFTDPCVGLALKKHLTQNLETVRWEEEELRKQLERQRKKDYLASLPRRQSSRRAGGAALEIDEDLQKFAGLN